MASTRFPPIFSLPPTQISRRPGFPPMIVVTASADPLLDEGIAVAAALAAAGRLRVHVQTLVVACVVVVP